jgi:hypothetical protein
MKKLADYTILPELRLILECCKGPTSVEDAVNMKNEEMSDKLYNPGYNIIVDIQEFETSLDSSTPDSVSNFYNFIKGVEIKGKIAFLTIKPHQVVLSEILKRLFKDFGTNEIEVFSTAEGAIRFLGYSIDDYDLINNKIIELNKNTF